MAVEFFFGECAFVAELLELTQLVDDAVLGVGTGVVGRVGAGVAVDAGDGPDQAKDPGEQGPPKEEVDGEDGAGTGVAAESGDNGGEEIGYDAKGGDGKAECSGEKVERIVKKHSWNKFSIFCFERCGIFDYFVIQSTF